MINCELHGNNFNAFISSTDYFSMFITPFDEVYLSQLFVTHINIGGEVRGAAAPQVGQKSISLKQIF